MKLTPAAARLAAVSLTLAALSGCGIDDRSARKAVATLLGVGPQSRESAAPAISEENPWDAPPSKGATAPATEPDPFAGPSPFDDLPAPPPPARNPFAEPPPPPAPEPAPTPAPKKAAPAPAPLTPSAPKPVPPPAPRPAPPKAEPKPTPKAEPPKPAPPKPVLELALPGAEPIAFPAVRGLIGKTVWSTTSRQLQTRGAGDVFVHAGQAVTLVKAEPFGEGFNYVTVKTPEGKTGEVQLQYLSRTALQVDLTRCGTYEELLAAAFREGLHDAIALHRFRVKHAWDRPDDDAGRHEEQSLEHAVQEMEQLLHGLVYGTHRSTADIMREGETRWVALADDERLLEVWSQGLEDQAAQRRLCAYEGVIDDFDAIDDAGFEIARVEREKQAKDWLRDTDGLPAKKVAALDQKELAERDARIAELRERITTRLASISAEAAKLLAGPPTG